MSRRIWLRAAADIVVATFAATVVIAFWVVVLPRLVALVFGGGR